MRQHPTEQAPGWLRETGVTRRELDVLRLVGQHLQNSEIAQALHLSERTVESHVSSLLRRLGVTNRRALVDTARRLERSRQQRLRQPLSSFVGRERETSELVALVEANRLVTLTGPPGVGKTRLALHLAGREPDLPAPLLVDLSLVPPGARVERAFADALGVVVGEADLSGRIRDVLAADAHWLLVDNCEHVVGPTSGLVVDLLGACPGLRVLATGHGPLGIEGEVVYDVAPLPQAEAELLLAERARNALPGFDVAHENAADVAAVCRALDRLPLAIELAAARLRVFSPAELLERLQDRFALLGEPSSGGRRHHTLEAAIRWSYELLGDDERTLLERCSVFPAGFDFDTADAVLSGPPLTHDDVVRIFPRLLDRSLLTSRREGSATEYAMLESIRQFAAARLGAHGATAPLRERHATFHLRRAPELAAELRGEGQEEALRWFESRWADIRTSMRWALDTGDTTLGWQFIAGVGTAWEVLGARGELFDWLTELLAQPPPAPLDVDAAITASLLLCYQDSSAALRLARRAEHLAQSSEPGDDARGDRERAMAGLVVGWALMYDGHAGPAREQLEAVAERLRRLGDDWHLAFALEGLGLAARDLDRTLEHLSRAGALFGAVGDRVKQSNCLNHMASRCLDVHERLDSVAAWLQESRALSRSTGSNHELLHAEVCQARLDQLHERHAEAAEAFEILLPQFRRIGDLRCMSRCLIGLGSAAVHGGAHAGAAEHLVEGARIADGTGDRREVSQALRLLATCAVAEGDARRAALLLGGADAVTAQVEAGRRPPERGDDLEEGLQERLGEQTYTELFRDGRDTPLADLLRRCAS